MNILEKLKKEGKYTELSIEESSKINSEINNKMKEVTRDYNKKNIKSEKLADEVIINT